MCSSLLHSPPFSYCRALLENSNKMQVAIVHTASHTNITGNVAIPSSCPSSSLTTKKIWSSIISIASEEQCAQNVYCRFHINISIIREKEAFGKPLKRIVLLRHCTVDIQGEQKILTYKPSIRYRKNSGLARLNAAFQINNMCWVNRRFIGRTILFQIQSAKKFYQ